MSRGPSIFLDKSTYLGRSKASARRIKISRKSRKRFGNLKRAANFEKEYSGSP